MNDTMIFKCNFGPLHGQQIELSVDHPYTLIFSMKGSKGRYVNPRDGRSVVVWEAA